MSGSESPGLSSTASPQASSSGASRSARRQLPATSPSGLSGLTGKNNRTTRHFLILPAAPATREVEDECRVDVYLTVRLSL